MMSLLKHHLFINRCYTVIDVEVLHWHRMQIWWHESEAIQASNFLQQHAIPCNIFVSDENSKLVLFFGGDQSLTMPSNSNFLFGLHIFIPLVLSSVFPLRVGFFHENWPFSPQMVVYISCLTHFAFTSLATFFAEICTLLCYEVYVTKT